MMLLFFRALLRLVSRSQSTCAHHLRHHPPSHPVLLSTPCHQSVQQRAEEIVRRFALSMLLLLSLL